MGEYDVEDFLIGDKTEGDKIVFKSVQDMEDAYKDIDNGNDIYIVKDGIVTKLLHQMISSKIYDGTLSLRARKIKKEQGGNIKW